MPGIGDSWGTEEELLHPRGPDGRWISAGGIAKSIIGAVMEALANFSRSHRSFQNRNQATQFLGNIAHRQGRSRMRREDHIRLARDLGPANADLRDGVIDEPSTKTFVAMMDRSKVELPDSVILTRTVGVDAFGFTPETAKGTDADNPGIRGMAGKLVADRGYGLTTIDGPHGAPPAGSVRMVIAAPKGTKVIIPAAGANDPTILTDRGQPVRVTRVVPDGAGGWTMYALAEEHDGKDVPEPMGGPIGPGREKSADREARIKETQRSLAQVEKVPDEQKEQEAEAARAAERAKMGAPVPSPAQEAERRRVEQQQPARQPAPGEPPPRTEPVVGRVGEAPAAGAPAPVATPAPGVPEPTPVPRRSVDLRLAVRDAKVPSPQPGPWRRQWNDAYLGVTGGKKDPIDAVRELDADIATAKRGEVAPDRGGILSRQGREATPEDIDALQQLRDVIAREYGLEESQPTPTPVKATKAAPAVKRTTAGLPKQEGLTPVKKAAPRKRAAAPKLEPSPKLEEARDLLRTAPEGETPEQELVRRRKAQDLIREAEREQKAAARKAAKKVAPVKKAAKKAAPSAPEAPGDDLDQMSKAQLLEVADKEGAPVRRSYNKDQLKNVLRNWREDKHPSVSAPVKKAAPEAGGDPLDKMTKAELLAESERRGVVTPKSWSKDKIKAHLRDEEVHVPVKKTPEQRRQQRRTDQKLEEEFRAREAAGEGVEGPDLEQAARDRQVRVDRARHYGRLGAEIEELINSEVEPDVLARGILREGRGLPQDDLDKLARAAESGNMNEVRFRMGELLQAQGVNLHDRPGAIERYDPRRHQLLGEDLPEGTMVHIVRPGSETRIDGEFVHMDKAVVEAATPQETVREEQAKRLVPEGSVPGARTDVPVDNAPRKRELRAAWIAADIQAPPGSGRKSQEEIKGDLLAGRITPEEAIRRFESEVSFNKEDLAEVDAHLRETDLGPDERARVERHRANLQATIEAHEKQSTFLRDYFKEEAPVVSLKEAKVQDPEAFEFLKDATPDDMREAAKEAGLDAPEGDNPDEMFRDLIKQVAKKELDRRAAKKAAKKAPAKAAKKAAPAVPADKERVDARLLAEGLDLDDSDIAMVQQDLDEGKLTPRQIAEKVDGHARARADSTGILYGNWEIGGGESRTPENEAERERNLTQGRARVQALRDLAERVRGVRRRKATAPAAKKAAPEVQVREEKIDDLQKRIIDKALEDLQGAKTIEQGQDALAGLTMVELRRLSSQSGIPPMRTKKGLQDAIIQRHVLDRQAVAMLVPASPAPQAPVPSAPRTPTLSARARQADIRAPGFLFSDVSSGVDEADRRLQRGDSHTEVARFLRERASRVAKADLNEEGRRFPTRQDPDTLKEIRKQSAEYLRRVATHVQQEGRGRTAAKKAVPSAPEPAGTVRAEGYSSAANAGLRVVADGKGGYIGQRQHRATGEWRDDPSLGTGNTPRDITSRQPRGQWKMVAPAKKATPPGAERGGDTGMTDAERAVEVKRLRDRARVERELAGMRQANNPPGSFHHNKGLQDEKDADRLDAEADALERGAPAPSAPVKAAKKAAPKQERPDLGEQVRLLARGTTRAEREGTDLPSPSRTGTSPAAPPRPTGLSPHPNGPVSGDRSRSPEIPNNWGALGTGGAVEFHADGVIGQRLQRMGQDRLMDVDGEPLSNVVGKLATRAIRGQISQDQLIDELRRLEQRLPEGSGARQGMTNMIADLDAPKRAMPDLPEGTPAPFRTAMQGLLQIPLARASVDRPGYHRTRENSEVDKLLRLIQDFREGRTGGLRMINEIQDMRRSLPHESQEGRFEADRVLRQLHDELDKLFRDKDTRGQLMPRRQELALSGADHV